MEEAKKPKETKMNKTWILIAVLVIITAALTVVSLTAKEYVVNPSKSNEAKVVSAQTSLMFSDVVRAGGAPGTYEVDINIDTQDNKVTLVQLEMNYNPSELSKVDIKPGNFIMEPVVIQKSINVNDGRIKYWIGIKPNQNGTSGKGVIATLVFAKWGTGAAQINFLPKTSVSAAGTDLSVLKNMVSGYILNVPTPSPSPSKTTSPSVSP